MPYVPGEVVETVMVSLDVVELPAGGVTELGENEHVEPVGHPDTASATAELNPFNDVTVIVELSEPVCWTVREVGDADREKSGFGDVTA
jgi:hypothetical protein